MMYWIVGQLLARSASLKTACRIRVELAQMAHRISTSICGEFLKNIYTEFCGPSFNTLNSCILRLIIFIFTNSSSVCNCLLFYICYTGLIICHY